MRHDLYSFKRQFKIYGADLNQLTATLDELAKTTSGQRRKIYYNPTWEYYKNYNNEQLAKPKLKALYVDGSMKLSQFSVI